MGTPRPERLIAARDLLGVSLRDLADSANISQSYFSEIASGRKAFLPSHADAVAKASGLPREFFDVHDAAPIDSLQFRKLASASARITRKAEQYFREISRIAQDVAAESGLTPKSLPTVVGDDNELDNADIEALAIATRELMNLRPDEPVPNMTRAIERLGIVVAPVVLDPLDDESQEVSPGHFGISHAGVEGTNPVIGYFPGSAPDRDRFTLAHELGHVLLHARRRPPEPEKEANYFAGALLLPQSVAQSELHSQITLNQLAKVKATFGVSIQALIMRASLLGIIDAKRQRSLFVQLSARGWRRDEPVEVVAEYPVLFRKMLEIAFPRTTSTKEIERTTALPRGYIRSMAPLPVRGENVARVQDLSGRAVSIDVNRSADHDQS